MMKKEFLDILRETLSSDMDMYSVEQNVQFYDDYISSKGRENEQSVLEELGDPRLIARSIIDASQKENHFANRGQNTANYTEDYTEGYGKDTTQDVHYKVFSNFKWYHKVIALLIILLLILFIIFVGKVVLGFVFTFGFPLLVLMIIIGLVRNRR